MSQKRKLDQVAEVESADASDASSASATKKSRPHAKKHKRPNANKDDGYGASANALKSRIRDLKRLLAHVENVPKHKMSAGARIERERELEACEHELAEKTMKARESEHRKKMIGKYHQVRFFDRQKATRVLKRLKKELAAAEDEAEKSSLAQRVHNVEVDVNYAINYPLMKPYSSLYPKTNSAKAEGAQGDDSKAKNGEVDGPKGDVEIWKAVERAMEDGSLETLRNSKSREDVPGIAPKQSKAKAKAQAKAKQDAPAKPVQPKEYKVPGPAPKNRREARAAARLQAKMKEDDDNDSDGGFFE